MLAPLVAGTIITVGVMGLVGVSLNPANMIGLPMIVGVGVDNGVHVLHDYMARCGKRAYTLAATTGKGIAVSAITTALGFGTLMVARHKGLAGLGRPRRPWACWAAWSRHWRCCRVLRLMSKRSKAPRAMLPKTRIAA